MLKIKQLKLVFKHFGFSTYDLLLIGLWFDTERLQVSCPSLENLSIIRANNITSLFSRQLPIAPYFSKLETLRVKSCGKLRNLMSLSVAKGLLNLRNLEIEDCESMEEVITKEEQQQGDGIMNLFPLLDELELCRLPKLGAFLFDRVYSRISISQRSED
ncbi:hypothetical protein H5410_054259 [Solanum commersonii]|uniref:Disease resistance protein At4g27190-like leucine-rich repeats domain-containing protein n=1 Tax=Solanum commersonii TaxID=4109 RepID=A0A9J5X9R0_SOLCO|nr:hypothetical protein H5410_054259 [Solanum commersonii]